MKPELVAVDRTSAQRAAVRAWRRSGAIDEATGAALERHLADGWRRPGWAFRWLLFAFTLIGVAGFVGFWLALFDAHDVANGGLIALAGLGLVAATELLQHRFGWRRAGVEEACAMLAVAALVVGPVWAWAASVKLGEATVLPVALALTAILCAAAAWRWGMPIFGGASAAAALVLAARLPAPRLAWIALALVLDRPLLAASAVASRPRALREAGAWTWAVLAGGLFLAVYLPSWDAAWIEHLGDHAGAARLEAMPWRALAALAMLAWPTWLLVAGVRRRRSLLLRSGAVLAVAAVAALARELTAIPLWARSVAGGLLLVGAALGLRRWLARGEGGERDGFTADPALAERSGPRLIEIAAVLGSLTPTPSPPAPAPGFRGEGGEFGGGGASAEF